ncbi:hypothetical protein B0T11DRAFT_128213 [Plectosphaerella cucumerina]|uniref:Uncharacterized protein n=1 Tax=Plectosphaerella cucumerina TaxID=40658 RepID=A0A8K0T974_9PEZI|nr:hypothetical protein B0T11DRAFT_128213 [Plectosphaerella cucumerina]
MAPPCGRAMPFDELDALTTLHQATLRMENPGHGWGPLHLKGGKTKHGAGFDGRIFLPRVSFRVESPVYMAGHNAGGLRELVLIARERPPMQGAVSGNGMNCMPNWAALKRHEALQWWMMCSITRSLSSCEEPGGRGCHMPRTYPYPGPFSDSTTLSTLVWLVCAADGPATPPVSTIHGLREFASAPVAGPNPTARGWRVAHGRIRRVWHSQW